MKTITLTDEQSKQLQMMFDCIEMWGMNSRGVGKLWDENKELIEDIYELLLCSQTHCLKHPDQFIHVTKAGRYCLECFEEAAQGNGVA